ncbi:5,10-methylenetetrahydromethanopterin reductase [Rhodococcus sp. 27YEA15]|uniref:LLM class flavin-dependent oxidoreductase n=1 Tax=Rhodococcus sp. 27YEA15 TaxID=3156259 RepID=UPI003C7E1702
MNATPTGRIGLLLASATPPEDVASISKQAEDLGFQELWVPEDYFFGGGMATAAIALAATTTIPVGIGVVASVVRHPAVTAMEIATLARAFPRRILPGIGHGVPAWTNQMGLTTKSPMSALRETLTSLKSLLAGETVSAEGRTFTFREVTLTHPVAEEVPLYTGVLGDKGIALTGELADGLIVSALSPVEYVEAARKKLDDAAAAAGRDTKPSISVLLLANVTSDPELAETVREEMKQILAFYIAATGPCPLFAAIGANEQIADMLSRGGPEIVAAEMPESWVDAFAVAGSVDDCRAKIAQYYEAGADAVVVSPVPAARAEQTLAAISELITTSV